MIQLFKYLLCELFMYAFGMLLISHYCSSDHQEYHIPARESSRSIIAQCLGSIFMCIYVSGTQY